MAESQKKLTEGAGGSSHRSFCFLRLFQAADRMRTAAGGFGVGNV